MPLFGLRRPSVPTILLSSPMRIHWYPAHMLTARKDAAVGMHKTDLVIEVLDARAPRASCNPVVETLRKQNRRPALKVLNMADLADAERTPAWQAYYNAQPEVRALVVSAKAPADVARILKAAREMVPGRGTPARRSPRPSRTPLA